MRMLAIALLLMLGWLTLASAQTVPGAGTAGPGAVSPGAAGPGPVGPGAAGPGAPGAPGGPGGAGAIGPGHPCIADAQRLCPGVALGGGAIRACLQQHAGELSPACRDNIRHRRRATRASVQACSGDVQKYCSSQEPGRRNMGACLREHLPQLSPECRQALETTRGPRR